MAEPVFVLATDLAPGTPAWETLEAQATHLTSLAARRLGFAPRVRVARLPTRIEEVETPLGATIARELAAGAKGLFVLPVVLELNGWLRTNLGQVLVAARRHHPDASVHHDEVSAGHPLLVDAFTDQVLKGIAEHGLTPARTGLVLVADGKSDPASRAESYRLMRLLWEQAGVARAEVAFLRQAPPSLSTVLERGAREPLDRLLLPQCQWDGALADEARQLVADHKRAHPDAAGCQLLDPLGDHPALLAWLEQRLWRLWRDWQTHQGARPPSAQRAATRPSAAVWSGKTWVLPDAADLQPHAGLLARVHQPASLRELLARVLPPSERYLLKVTWHGYAPGTYTSPEVLDLLLGALPGKAVLLEGHTSGRNLGGADWDWETDAGRHRGWIRQQEAENLRRTGLAEVIARHGAQYLNVTEAWWDRACAPEAELRAALGDLELHHPELAGFVPARLLELRGLPFLSVARFKGPTRLGISNLFGLIPHPLRLAWHGPNLTWFASVCCDLARIYGRLFPLFGFVEAIASAVRWNRKGLYRSRWGNYDLVLTDGLLTLSEGLVGADLLASRLQGQDVQRSGFFDVVRARLGWSHEAATGSLPVEVQAVLA